MSGGWIKLYWKTKDSIVGSDLAILGFWTRLLLSVARRDVLLRNGRILRAGEAIVSSKEWSEWGKMSDRTVRRIFSQLESEGMITVLKRDRNGTHVSICNWATYQNSDDQVGQQRPSNGEATAIERRRNDAQTEIPKIPKKPKNVRTYVRVRPLDEEEFDSLRPRCMELKDAVDANPRRELNPEDRELCVKAVVMEHHGIVDLSPLMLSVKRKKLETGTRWGYFRGTLKNAVEASGHNFHEVYKSTAIPPPPEPAGASP